VIGPRLAALYLWDGQPALDPAQLTLVSGDYHGQARVCTGFAVDRRDNAVIEIKFSTTDGRRCPSRSRSTRAHAT